MLFLIIVLNMSLFHNILFHFVYAFSQFFSVLLNLFLIVSQIFSTFLTVSHFFLNLLNFYQNGFVFGRLSTGYFSGLVRNLDPSVYRLVYII